MSNFQEEYRQVSRQLQKHHSVFYKMWEHGSPELTEKIPTAALEFDPKTGKPLRFLFNPKFWDSIDEYTRAFVVAHECSHGTNNHGYRAKSLLDAGADHRLINQAMDVAINHMLISSFGFERELINGQENYCWVDTVFPDQFVSDNLAFEEYYDLLKKQSGDDSGGSSNSKGSPGENSDQPQTIDSHEGLSDFDIDDLIEEMSEDLDNYEVEKFNEKVEGCGDGMGGFRIIPPKSKLYATEKWDKLVKKWKRTGYNPPDESMQWVMPNRRFSSLPDDILLPADSDPFDSEYCKSKIDLWIFVDVSSSCEHIWEQFFLAVDTIPDSKFNKRTWVFASKTQEIKGRNIKVHGVGSGTSFFNVAQTVKSELLKKEPDIIMVITDGAAGHSFKYPCPEKWNYFIDASRDEPNIDTRKQMAKRFISEVPENIKSHYLVDYFVPISCQSKVE